MKMRKKKLHLAFVLLAMMLPIGPAIRTEAVQTDAVGGRNTEADVQPVADGTYQIFSALDNNYVWDIADASLDNEANLQLNEKKYIDSQRFIFTYHSNGYYTITNVNSRKAVDCAGGAAVDGTNIWQYASNNTSAQMWKLTDAGDGYYTFTCKCNGMAADVKNGIAANGTNIQMYHSNGTMAQKFQLIAAGRIMGRNAEVSSAASVYIVFAGMIGGGYYLNRMLKEENGRKNHVI